MGISQTERTLRGDFLDLPCSGRSRTREPRCSCNPNNSGPQQIAAPLGEITHFHVLLNSWPQGSNATPATIPPFPGPSGDVDFFRELLCHCIGKRIEVLHDEQERIGSANHVLPVIQGQPGGRLRVGGTTWIRLVVDCPVRGRRQRSALARRANRRSKTRIAARAGLIGIFFPIRRFAR